MGCSRVKVKICGITRREDALVAAEAGADAVGFVFFPKSPRFVTPEAAAGICRGLPPFLARVGVFVNPEADFVRRAVALCGLTVLQFHGEESPQFYEQFRPLPVIAAFRIGREEDLAALPRRPADAWLLDASRDGAYGGTGVSFDWNLAAAAKELGAPIILAGGLTPENAAEAARRVRPYALDVSSGVESAPGVKDAAKIRAFLDAVRNA
ncbi:MAG: phosphoribosylanthranilate isomerase [Verrucomicrobia bacterium]|nr:phosphoribosylanthranilate isomerase [Verrucomicrobiota bacterium]